MTDKEKLDKLVAEMIGDYNIKTEKCRGINEQAHQYYGGKRDALSEILKSIDTMQKEPKECMYSKDNYTDEDRKVLCEGCEEECKFNKKEEPASEDLDKEIDNAHKLFYEEVGWDSAEGARAYVADWFAHYFANWQKQQMEAYRIEHCKSLTNEQAELEDNFVSSHVEKNNRIPTFIDAIEYGMEYCKQQMMAKAVDATVHIDAGGYPYIPQMELYDYDKDIPFAKEGDKYKVILIKEADI